MKDKNKDGSPVTVWCPAYRDYTEVSNWFDYHYFGAFDGENDERANAIADLKTYKG